MNLLQKHTWIFFLLGFLLFASCQEESEFIYPNKRIIQLGDDLNWADPLFDDSDWDPIGSTNEVGQFWVRFHIIFDDKVEKLNNKGIQMVSLGSYEAYWDGVLIHENGRVGDARENEMEGKFISQFLIPDSLCYKGSHVLALRLSNFQNNVNDSWSWNTFKVEEFYFSLKKGLKITALMFVLGGCFLLVALYYFLLFFKEKRNVTNLVFSTMCLMFFGLMIFEYLKFYWAYPYSFHSVRLLIIGSLTGIIAFVVPLFLCLHLKIPRKDIFLALLGLVLLLIVFTENIKFDTTAQLFSSIMLFSSIGLSAYAYWLKRNGSGLILLSFLLVTVINYFSTFHVDFLIYSYDINLFLSFMILVLAILYSLSNRRKEQQEAYEASLLLSERLKNELLKKNIQPHFIMNTLTSIMEWVEVSPKKSIVFIEALAGEFDLLNEMADEKLVPIKQEIDLCKKHLEIMTFRKEAIYTWEDENIDFSKTIPPAIFHTVIENGITHSITPKDDAVRFKLSQVDAHKQIIYRIEVFAENRKKKSVSNSGTGFKYIRSRLTESYGDGWGLKSMESPNGWLTEIIILH